jgi:hypothetical protein
MNKKVKVKNNTELVRDSFSKAIINIDHNNYAQALTRKKSLLAKDDRIKALEDDIMQLKNDYAILIKLIKDDIKI